MTKRTKFPKFEVNVGGSFAGIELRLVMRSSDERLDKAILHYRNGNYADSFGKTMEVISDPSYMAVTRQRLSEGRLSEIEDLRIVSHYIPALQLATTILGHMLEHPTDPAVMKLKADGLDSRQILNVVDYRSTEAIGRQVDLRNVPQFLIDIKDHFAGLIKRLESLREHHTAELSALTRSAQTQI